MMRGGGSDFKAMRRGQLSKKEIQAELAERRSEKEKAV
jgi:hypothetical protein